MQNYTGGAVPQQNGISTPAFGPQANPDTGYNDMFYPLEQEIGAQAQKIMRLVQNGSMTNQQGQYLISQLAQKAQSINAYKSSLAQQQNFQNQPVSSGAQIPQSTPVQNPMELFNQERPGFFEAEGRGDVLNYIKGFDMDKDEILRIANLVEGVENSAVNKYLKKSAHEKSLNDENALAKSKLMAYAQNGSYDGNMDRIFTREDIGNMSGEEFTRNEKLIMDQVKRGLIK